jgi:glycosyltransferase involved in cell wall biosynthesis
MESFKHRSRPIVRVLFVVPRYHTNQLEWVQALRASGCRVDMLVYTVGPTEDHSKLSPKRLPESLVSRAIRWIFGDGGTNCQHYFPQLHALIAYAMRNRPDLVVIRPHGMVYSLAASIVFRAFGATVIGYHQRVEPKPLAIRSAMVEPHRLAYRLLMRCISARNMTPLWSTERLHAPMVRWSIVPFAVPVEPRLPRKALSAVRVLTIGKMVPRKRIDLLLHAIAKCRVAGGTDVRLTVVGECSTPEHQKTLEDLRKLTANLSLTDVTEFVLNVPPADMGEHYQRADLFVLPAEREPASVSVIEAMGYGVPAVCSDTCGTKCYITEGVTGWVFHSGSLEALIATLARALQSRERLEAMGSAAQQDAGTHFSAAAFIPALNEALAGTSVRISEEP